MGAAVNYAREGNWRRAVGVVVAYPVLALPVLTVCALFLVPLAEWVRRRVLPRVRGDGHGTED